MLACLTLQLCEWFSIGRFEMMTHILMSEFVRVLILDDPTNAPCS